MGWTSIDGYNSQDASSHLHCCCCWTHPVREWKMGASKQGSPCLEGFLRVPKGTSPLGPRLSSSTKEDAQQLLRHRVSGFSTADPRDSSVGVGPRSQLFIFFWTSVFRLLLLLLLRGFSLSPDLLRSLGILSTFRHELLTSSCSSCSECYGDDS
jgi:hypothetical protein